MIHTNSRHSIDAKSIDKQSLPALLKAYKLNNMKLLTIAQNDNCALPDDNPMIESHIMEAQERLLEDAIAYPIANKADFDAIFDIWYQAVIKEQGEDDLSVTDRLIWKLYKHKPLSH